MKDSCRVSFVYCLHGLANISLQTSECRPWLIYN